MEASVSPTIALLKVGFEKYRQQKQLVDRSKVVSRQR
jgi:hypothetical protein